MIESDGRPVFVNTRFDCLATVDERYNFAPLWKPRFLSGLVPEDRCHLNGLAAEDGKAKYVTMVARQVAAASPTAGVGPLSLEKDDSAVIPLFSNPRPKMMSYAVNELGTWRADDPEILPRLRSTLVVFHYMVGLQCLAWW